MFSYRIGFQQLFGWHGYQTNAKKYDKVVITSSEFDAMAITQETDMLGLSVPKGTELPLEVSYEYKYMSTNLSCSCFVICGKKDDNLKLTCRVIQ